MERMADSPGDKQHIILLHNNLWKVSLFDLVLFSNFGLLILRLWSTKSTQLDYLWTLWFASLHHCNLLSLPCFLQGIQAYGSWNGTCSYWPSSTLWVSTSQKPPFYEIEMYLVSFFCTSSVHVFFKFTIEFVRLNKFNGRIAYLLYGDGQQICRRIKTNISLMGYDIFEHDTVATN